MGQNKRTNNYPDNQTVDKTVVKPGVVRNWELEIMGYKITLSTCKESPIEIILFFFFFLFFLQYIMNNTDILELYFKK